MINQIRIFTLFALGVLLQINLAAQGAGQQLEDFELFGVAPNSFLNNAGASGYFESDLVRLPNDFNEEFGFWSGWALSSMTDTETPGFTNQYSAITGNGADGSDTYAVTFVGGGTTMELPNKGSQPQSMMITNSTYAYYSMLEGDAFAKRFGGEDGTDPDFLRVIAHGFLNGFQAADSIVVYLADFRFDNPEDDYIVSDWLEVDLRSLQEVDSIQFKMESSDVGAFGINTPLYFCMDQVKIDLTTLLTPQRTTNEVSLFPNPARDQIVVRGFKNDADVVHVYDGSGKLVKSQQVKYLQATIRLHDLVQGTYFIRSEQGVKGRFVRK